MFPVYVTDIPFLVTFTLVTAEQWTYVFMELFHFQVSSFGM